MYSKLFSRITESSLMEESINTRYTFVMMLAVADPEGYVIGTDVAISRRLNMNLAEFQACLEVLMSPDPNSNSKEMEGRRIVVSDCERGYLLVNYVKYRDTKTSDDRRTYMREYMRERRRKEREVVTQDDVASNVNSGKPELAELGHADEVCTHAATAANSSEKKERTPSMPTHTHKPNAGTACLPPAGTAVAPREPWMLSPEEIAEGERQTLLRVTPPPNHSQPDWQPVDGPQRNRQADCARLLMIWQRLPRGKGGVVPFAGLPEPDAVGADESYRLFWGTMSPKDREAIESFWPCRELAATQAMDIMASGDAIGWDRNPMSIRQFRDEIDNLIGGYHQKHSRSHMVAPNKGEQQTDILRELAKTAKQSQRTQLLVGGH